MSRNCVYRLVVLAILIAQGPGSYLLSAEGPAAKPEPSPTAGEPKKPSPEDLIRQALNKRVELKYTEEPLWDVLKDLHAKLGIPIQLDAKAIGDVGINHDTPVTYNLSTISARAAIALMLRSLNLTTVIKYDTLLITTPEEAESALQTRVYDVSDLVRRSAASDEGQPDFDSLIGVIRVCILSNTWDSVGGPGSIEPFTAAGLKVLVVAQTDEAHEEIESVLAELRAVRDRKNASSKSSPSSDHSVQTPVVIVDARLPRIPEAEASVRRALAKPVSYQFSNAPLGTVLMALKEKTGHQVVLDVNGSTGELVFDPQSRQVRKGEIAVSINTPVTAEAANVPLAIALDQMLDPLGLMWTYYHECLLITTNEREERFLVDRHYDVSDLPAYRDKNGKGVPDYKALIGMFASTVEPRSWDAVGGPGRIAVLDQRGLQEIAITQQWKTHLKIEKVLAELRYRRGPLPTAEQIAKLPPLPAVDASRHGREPEGPFVPPPPPDPRREAIVNSNNQFAFDLYRQLSTSHGDRAPDNLFFSPYSISTALATVYAGARDPTAEEMAKTLHIAMPQGDVSSAFQSLLATLPTGNQRGCQLTVANRLWGQQGYAFSEPFLKITRDQFGAELAKVDFGQPEAVCRALNAWAEEKTAGKIKQIAGPDTINNNLRFVLTNAVYFKGQWSDKFEEFATRRAPFHVDGTINVAMMHQTADCLYGVSNGVTIIEKTYRGKNIAMMILLPKEGPEALNGLERLLSPEKLKDWSSHLQKQSVRVYLPRFKLETSVDLDGLLRSMGMARVFHADQADLSGISGGKEPLWLGAVLHRAFVNVDEEGTEAAAVSGVMGCFGGPPLQIPMFRADHPFVFLIRDTRTGNILFVGRVMKPDPAPEGMPKEKPSGPPPGGGMGMF